MSIGVCVIYAQFYLPYHEHRLDLVRIEDKVLDMLPIINLSNQITVFLLTCIIISVLDLWYTYNFYEVEKLALKYACSILVKTVTLYITPLDVPKGYIVMQDKISAFISNSSAAYGKDLFFSGHTVLAYLCFVSTTNFYTSTLLFICMILLGISLMINRAHYSIDIFMAPFVGYACHKFVENNVS